VKNVLITTSSFGEEILETLRQGGVNPVLNPYRRKLGAEEADLLIQEHRPVGIIAGVEPLTRAVLCRAPFLRAISRCGIGMDSVDLAAARELGIDVTNTPDAPTIPVAELTVGMILSLLRSLHHSDASVRGGGWERPMGGLLHGKTVGVVGCGRIGSYVAELLAPFGCRLLGCDPGRASHPRLQLLALDAMLPLCDVVTLHLPCTAQTRGVLDAPRIAAMKTGAMLVNASRGGLVDEGALVRALEEGKLSGAALDCFDEEPYRGALTRCKNTLLTAHIGSYAREGRVFMERQAAENLLVSLRVARAAA